METNLIWWYFLTNGNTRFREAAREQGDCIASKCWHLCSKTGWLSDAKASESSRVIPTSVGVSDSDYIFAVAPAPAGHVTMVLVSVG